MTQPEQALLLSPRTRVARTNPFFHLQLDDFLPPGQYRELLKGFPGREWFPETIEGNKHRLNSRSTPEAFRAFCRTRPAWTRLFDQLSSEPFLDALYALVREPLRQARGLFGSRPWRLHHTRADGILNGILTRRVKVTFEFSRLERGGIVPPHTDAPEKLVTIKESDDEVSLKTADVDGDGDLDIFEANEDGRHPLAAGAGREADILNFADSLFQRRSDELLHILGGCTRINRRDLDPVEID